MKIKRYIGNTTHEAMKKLKIELGSDAVILHTRKIKKPGFLGLFKKPLVEIVAAIDDVEISKDDSLVGESNTKLKPNLFKYNEVKNHNIDDEFIKLRQTMETLIKKINNNEYIDKLPFELIKFRDILTSRGVDSAISTAIIKNLQTKTELKLQDTDNIKKELIDEIIKCLDDAEPITLNGSTKYIFFVGPPGVGKTTTLAKIAAQYAIDNRDDIALVTLDTYRVAAVEQLKVYSDILNIPLEIVYNTEEIWKALSKFKNKELVMIDTAGRNHKDKEKMEEIKNIIKQTKNKEVFLVLDATTNISTIKAVLDTYNLIDNFKIIFTKIDQVDNYGIIFNTKFYSKNPLSYITNGQSVPEDIMIADKNYIAKSLIEEL